MKKFVSFIMLVLLLPVHGFAEEAGRIVAEGEVKVGGVLVDSDTNSSKFNEYRDIKNTVFVPNVEVKGLDTQAGRFAEFSGKNVFLDDQSLNLVIGGYGSWSIQAGWDQIPHRLSNKAMTPYNYQGNGLFTVPATVPLATYNLAPAAGVLAQAGGNDELTAAYLETYLHPTEIGTQRERGSVGFAYTPAAGLKFSLNYAEESKDGSKITYGPIGDRPPRSLNIQLTEPVDYTTRDLRFTADYAAKYFQGQIAYLISDFSNNVDKMTWQNIYTTPVGGADYQTWNNAYNISTFGQRALPPDNRYQNASLSFGVDLPLDSRLAATGSYGWMEQNETLLPYSYSGLNSATAFNSTDNALFPRKSADAEIKTMAFNVDYTINPIDRMNVKGFYRFYELDNNTPTSEWRYVTNDTIPTVTATSTGNTNPTYLNQRKNLAYAYTKNNYGVDTSYTVWKSTFGLGYEREEIDRDFREANTEENMYKASVNTRPLDWLALRLKYLYGDREGSAYNYNVTSQSYWYPITQSSADNPAYAFGNHPDLRKYDVSDRERNQVDATATVTPVDALTVSASYNYRNDDYASGVTPIKPMEFYAGLPVLTDPLTRDRTTPGDQLGLLKEKRQQYGMDAAYEISERFTFNLFGNQESSESTQRGMSFNENARVNPGSVTLPDTTLGPWDRASSQWTAVLTDKTDTVGAGAGYVLVKDKLNFTTDFTYAFGRLDIDYSGWGSGASFPDTNEYAFRSTDQATHRQYTVNAALEYKLAKNWIAGVSYLYDSYKIRDWMQESDTPWTESVGNEYMLRDTSSATSTQWGNRLVSMGSYLGPSYETHVGYLTLAYKF